MLRMQALLDQIQTIDGWLLPDEAEALAAGALLALATSRGAWVELGSWRGKSTVLLASLLRELRPEQPLWAIDPHMGALPAPGKDEPDQNASSWPVYVANLQRHGVEANVETIRAPAESVTWTDPIAFLYHDSLHDYGHARAHLDVYEPMLERGAVVAFHDCEPVNWPGVVRLVAELEDGGYERLWQAGSMAVLRKP